MSISGRITLSGGEEASPRDAASPVSLADSGCSRTAPGGENSHRSRYSNGNTTPSRPRLRALLARSAKRPPHSAMAGAAAGRGRCAPGRTSGDEQARRRAAPEPPHARGRPLGFEKPYPGWSASSLRIRASRAVLARIEAAAMVRLLRSPFMMACRGVSRSHETARVDEDGACGAGKRPSTARRMAGRPAPSFARRSGIVAARSGSEQAGVAR